MIVGVPCESYPGERRVALVPAVLSNLAKAGLQVLIEAGAGAGAGYPDAEYSERVLKLSPLARNLFRKLTSWHRCFATAPMTKPGRRICRC
jgi:NAD(P) transhydrogenase subunit alpha